MTDCLGKRFLDNAKFISLPKGIFEMRARYIRGAFHLTNCHRTMLVVTALLCMSCQDSVIDEGPAKEMPLVSSNSDDVPIIPLDEVKPSQSGSVSQAIADTDVVITYDRPVARGRELYGGIVPYGDIWNPGANNATEMWISRCVNINGRLLDAGNYSIWAIPDPTEWTVIFSRATNVFHEPYPGEQHDALRLAVIPTRGDHMETLAFYFSTVEKKTTELRLHWGETVVPLAITVQ